MAGKPDHPFGEVPAAIEQGRYRQGLFEQFLMNCSVEGLLFLPVQFFSAPFSPQTLFRLQDPQPQQGAGNLLPVDAQGKDPVVTQGMTAVFEIVVEDVLKDGPSLRLIIVFREEITKGECLDAVGKGDGKIGREGIGNAKARKGKSSFFQAHGRFPFLNL